MLPDRGIDRRNRGNAVEQSSDVQAGAADYDGKSTRLVNLRYLMPRHFGPIRRGAGPSAIEDAVQPMFGLGPLFGTWCGAQDRQVAIDLRAIGVDDHAAGLHCKLKCQCRLAARGGAGNQRHRRTNGHCDPDSSRTA